MCRVLGFVSQGMILGGRARLLSGCKAWLHSPFISQSPSITPHHAPHNQARVSQLEVQAHRPLRGMYGEDEDDEVYAEKVCLVCESCTCLDSVTTTTTTGFPVYPCYHPL